MEVSSVLVEAAYLLLVGMSVVYAFLALMILTIKLVAWLDQKWPESALNASLASQRSVVNVDVADSEPSATIVAAITAAIHQHRQSR
jgi:oxaloacetate decarboxylase (Na+ extruding) subunit gamma